MRYILPPAHEALKIGEQPTFGHRERLAGLESGGRRGPLQPQQFSPGEVGHMRTTLTNLKSRSTSRLSTAADGSSSCMQSAGTGTSGSFCGGFGSGFSSSFGSSFGQSGSSTDAVTFGFGSQTVTFGSTKTKELAELPDFTKAGKVPVGHVLGHGSGECHPDLGDDMRGRKTPTLLNCCVSRSICEIAVGAMHVLCLSARGAVYSWGCNDDGALGRAPSDVSDGGPLDVEPHPVTMPSGVAVRHVSCGDCHSCALDEKGRAWLWGTYKDSNGYIGIAHKRKQETEVMEKSAEPTLGLEGCLQIASGASPTVALASASGQKQVFAWGSNATSMTAEQIQQAVVQGATALVLQAAEREVPKPEKQKLLQPKHVPLEVGAGEHAACGVHATAECSFISFEDGAVFGCGLNGDGRVGLGFVSMAVQQLQEAPALRRASWIGGGRRSKAALVDGRVLTCRNVAECGIGLGEKDPPVLQPRELQIQGLPRVRALRRGGHHMASTEGGDPSVLRLNAAGKPTGRVKPSSRRGAHRAETRPGRSWARWCGLGLCQRSLAVAEEECHREGPDGVQASADAGKLLDSGTSPGFGGATTSGTACRASTTESVVFGFSAGTPAKSGATGALGSFGGGFGSGFGQSLLGRSGSSLQVPLLPAPRRRSWQSCRTSLRPERYPSDMFLVAEVESAIS
ncbi:rcc1 [Symbiodinium sp. CCMP2456]|nr:rcc1 [Symbiodinium sp. CCMP2456]